MTTHQVTQFINQNLKSVSSHFDIYRKHIFILRYNFSEHLKNIHGECIQKCQSQELLRVNNRNMFMCILCNFVWFVCISFRS